MNVYRTIWLAPKRTFEEFLASDGSQALFVLPILTMGLIFGLDLIPKLEPLVGEGAHLLALTLTLPLGIATAFLILGLITPGLIRLFGRIWRGPATMRQLVNVCSISFIPFGLTLINQLTLFAVGQEPTLDNVNGGIIYTLSIWCFGLLVIGVSKVQRFSYGMALLNILISDLPLLIIGLLRN
ncbi:MAG: YIP1 family protein [Imperialibacter sp.]